MGHQLDIIESQNFKKKTSTFLNSTLILVSFATAFFPRILTYFGAPSSLNFVHFFTIPAVCGIALFTTCIKHKKTIYITWQLIFRLGILFACMTASALVNQAGFINLVLQFLITVEPFVLLVALIAVPITGERLKRFRRWFLGFSAFNLILALAQSILIPIGIYPRRGGTIADGIGGVFGGGGGSAANYISCTVSIYVSLYFLLVYKSVPLWIRLAGIAAALYQTQVSDSKQVFLAIVLGCILVFVSNSKNPIKILLYLLPMALFLGLFIWALQNLDLEFLDAYRNWIERGELYGSDGEATRTKLATFPIVLSHYETPLNWFFGLGPGHTVTRLGGWMLPKYASLLSPLGATIHPASAEVFQVVYNGWIAQESTIFFPLFTWAGLWGDLGFVGLGAYIYLASIVWRKLCFDNLCKFLLLSTAVFGFILTQMEEPGHMLTVACLIGLRWQEKRES